MTKSYTSAMEGIFDPEATVDSLLATVKENITSKVTSVDQAADLENRLSEEAAEFNSMLATISTAMRQCEAGEITKEEALAAAKPCVDALKERCEALKLGGVDVKDDDITENEIAMLREYIVGCKDIVAAHKETLQGCPITQNEEKSEEASEGVLSYLGNLDVANEASMAMSVRNSNDAKNATALYKNAKKLYAMGSKDKAKTYMQQAKAKYEKCLEAAKKAGKPHKVERTVGTASVANSFVSFNKDTDASYTAYTVPGMAYVVRYFEDRVDTCEAYLRQWANKAGNKDLQETKEMLKKERQEEKARIRAERKAAKEKAASESAMIEAELSALESIMDGYELDLTLEAALEAEGSDSAPASKASGIGSKLRSAFGKLKDAFKKGDKKAADAANEEIKTAAKELDDAANSSDEEGKKKLSTAAKIGIAAAAATALVAGDVALGQILRKKAEANTINSDFKGLTSMIVRSSNAICNKVSALGPAAQKAKYELTNKAFYLAKGQKAEDKMLKKVKGAYNAVQAAEDKRKAYQNKLNASSASISPTKLEKWIKGMALSLGKWKTIDPKVNKLKSDAEALASKVAAASAKLKAEEAKKPEQQDSKLIANLKTQIEVLASEGSKINEQINDLKGNESFSSLVGADFLATLAMEEANFTDDVPLTEIENEEGRGFDDEAQGEDLTDEAIVGVDDLDDEDEVEESVLESTLSVMMLEDGLDPDED